ncbi:hypothetical protein EJK50_0023 [Moraxella catarrhalis]|nr:hypothetical protein EJK50_0023 [Moraxella catarrhalis]
MTTVYARRLALHDRTGRLEKIPLVLTNTAILHDRTGRLEKFTD